MKCRDIGPLDAKILIIGEAPGREEEACGMPFVGQSGKLLKNMCSTVGIDFNRCYITNIRSDRPPNNNFGYFYEDSKRNNPKETLRKSWFDLGDKIKRIKPEVVICLGDEPLRAVTNLRGITSWRGTRLEAYDTKVIATFHPSNILRVYSNRVIAEMDLTKALRESKGLIYKNPNIITSPSVSCVLGWINAAKSRSRKQRVSFDIETIGKHVRCIGFARRSDILHDLQAICIPFMQMINSSNTAFSAIGNNKIKINGYGEVNYWSKSDEELVLEAIALLLEDENIEKVGQNSIHFDAPLIKNEFGIDINNHKMDTMHAWHLLYPSLPKSLDFISSVLTDHPNYWTHHEVQVDQSEWHYNAMDCIATLEASELIDKELSEENLADLYYSHVHPLTFDLLKAQERGVTWDKDAADKMKIRLSKDLIETQEKLNLLLATDVNPNSPKQIKQILYEKLRFPVVYHHKTKKSTVDENALLKLEEKYPNEPALALIIKYRKISKLISTFIDVTLDADGRMRCSYNPSGTITGRIASSKTIWGTGMNLQNVPKGYTRGVESTRHLYKAADGNVFVIGDLKQAEAMVVAWILKSLGDPTLFDFYHQDGFDIHLWCASIVYGVDEKDVTKIQRQGGKLANHSGNYMAGPGVMEKKARKDGFDGFTYGVCKEILEKRKRAIPGLETWWNDVERKVKATRTLSTCFGRRLHFFNRIEGEELRSAVAFEPQSTVGDVCNVMFRELSQSERYLHFVKDQPVYWPVLTTHDEIVLECKEQNKHVAAQAMLGASKLPLQIRPNIEPLIIPIEISIGKNWGDTKEWKG